MVGRSSSGIIGKFGDIVKSFGCKRQLLALFIILLVISLIFNGIQWYFLNLSKPNCDDTSICIVAKQIDDSIMYVGINDGTKERHYFNQFDPKPDSNCKNGIDAQTTSAQLECDIYTANRNISGPFITLLIVTTLSRSATDTNFSITQGINDLRGAYIAQKYYNQDKGHVVKLRLLIANIGTRSAAVKVAPDLIKQIEQLPAQDSTFGGIVGFPFSFSALAALNSFKNRDIPIVSPSASSDSLSAFHNFYRIVPTDETQSRIIQNFIKNRLLPTHLLKNCVAVFHNDADPYSKTLGNRVLTSGIPSPETETYKEGDPESLLLGIDDVLKHHCGMIFFAGFPEDLNSLRDLLKERTKSPSSDQNIIIMGGGALYDLGGYTGDNYKNLIFTANATYAHLNPRAEDANFEQEYHETFDPKDQYSGQYGAGLPGVQAILSFDAVSTFLHALGKVPSNNTATSWLKNISDALQEVEFNGVSGYINLVHKSLPNSDPVNKYLYMACTDSGGHTQVISTYQFVNNEPAEVDAFHSDVLYNCLNINATS